MAPVLAVAPAPGTAAAHRENRVRGFSALRWDRVGVDVPISLKRTGENGAAYDGSRRPILYYLRARYYDASTAQFLTRDPLVAMTLSRYGYMDGDPLNAGDPTGLDWWNPTTWGVCLRNPFGGDNGNGGCHTTLSSSQGAAALAATGVIAVTVATAGAAGLAAGDSGLALAGGGIAGTGAAVVAGAGDLAAQGVALIGASWVFAKGSQNCGDEMGTGHVGGNRGTDFTNYLAQKYGLNPDKVRMLHDAITGQNYDRATIEEIARSLGEKQ